MGSIGKKRVILSQLYHPIFTILQLNCAKIPNFLKFRIIISNVLDSLQNYNFFSIIFGRIEVSHQRNSVYSFLERQILFRHEAVFTSYIYFEGLSLCTKRSVCHTLFWCLIKQKMAETYIFLTCMFSVTVKSCCQSFKLSEKLAKRCFIQNFIHDILFPKSFWPSVRKQCSRYQGDEPPVRS